MKAHAESLRRRPYFFGKKAARKRVEEAARREQETDELRGKLEEYQWSLASFHQQQKRAHVKRVKEIEQKVDNLALANDRERERAERKDRN